MVDILKVRDRIFEGELLQFRGFRVEHQGFINSKSRLNTVDALFRGDWSEVFGDESTIAQMPHVMNLVQVGMNDIATLVTESTPAVKCLPDKETKGAEDKANVREAIADTYWEVNDGEALVPQLAMDIAGAGFACLVAYPDADSIYPCVQRVNPRFAYPDVRHGKLLDLLTVETINVRIAAREFGELLGWTDSTPEVTNSTVEIILYYSAEECVQAVSWEPLTAGRRDGEYTVGQRQAKIVDRWHPIDKEGKPYLPAVLVQLESFDGEFRGMFDQVAGSLRTKDRIVKQMVDYTDRFVYPSMKSKGLLNPQEKPGPFAHFRLNEQVDGADIGYVEPPGPAPQIFSILEYLDKENRGGVAYPSARQGEVSQSQASGSFVASTQGQLSSVVRNIQRLLGRLRSDLNEVWFKIDESYKDEEKPLIRPIGQKTKYLPSRDIGGMYINSIVYGASAGLNREAADVRLMQFAGASIISADTVRENVDFIVDPRAEGNKVAQQQTEAALTQKLFSEGSIQDLQKLLMYQAQGDSMGDALVKLAKEQQAQAPAPAPAEVPGQQPEAEGPGAVSADQQALESGGIPGGGAGQAVQPVPPPMENILVQQPPAGRAFTQTGSPG
jgi:hypothetical protein